MTKNEMLPCLMCGEPCESGTFCGPKCEKTDAEMQPMFDAAMRRLGEVFADMDRAEAARGLRAPVVPTVEDMVREAMLEGMAWDAFREAKATGVWH